MFQPIYKTFKMPAGLTDTIMKWDLKGCQMKNQSYYSKSYSFSKTEMD